MSPDRRLTKSLFKTGTSCPTKLFYSRKPDQFPDKNDDNEFMKGLAEGGYQVGAYAQLHFPDGVEITTRDKQQALAQTRELLQRPSVVIFEAAIGHGPFYALVDILIKDGNTLTLIEVKSKKYKPEDSFFTKKVPHYLSSSWRPYLLDVAFQTWVARHEFPEFVTNPELMLLDSGNVATIDGLNTWFPIERLDGDKIIVKDVAGRHINQLCESLMTRIPVDEAVERILSRTDADPARRHPNEPETFEGWVRWLANAYVNDVRIEPALGTHCKNCEFRVKGARSGFDACWGPLADEPLVFDIWSFLGARKMLEQDVVRMSDPLVAASLPPIQSVLNKRGDPWTPEERQALQVHLTTSGATEPIIHSGLKAKMRKCAYPLRFIDFEAGTLALPFHKGHGAYQKVAFQFSIHTLFEDGRLEHTHEWLHTNPGEDPNVAFVEALKDALDPLEGTQFSYSSYEQTTMNQMREHVEDRPDLLDFIDRLEFTDLWVMLKHYYIHPLMGGSNSIKAVLPAILGRDPYKELAPIPSSLFDGRMDDGDESGEVVNDGGKAMMAWAELQFTDVDPKRREAVREALLRYCELDTWAMAQVWLAWEKNV
jgi:hypothetical protein